MKAIRFSGGLVGLFLPNNDYQSCKCQATIFCAFKNTEVIMYLNCTYNQKRCGGSSILTQSISKTNNKYIPALSFLFYSKYIMDDC